MPSATPTPRALFTGKKTKPILKHALKKICFSSDLKPENLLLDSNLSLKLVDFGFTKKFEPGKLMGSFCGSVAYAAPELIQKEKYSGPETDVWSLGVILYALLVGRLPFDDPNGTALTYCF